MNKHEILRHLAGFCPDITVDGERYVYINNNFVCGLEVSDDTLSIFYPYRKKERIDVYGNINGYDDIIAVWSEFMHRWNKINNRLRKDKLNKLIQGSV